MKYWRNTRLHRLILALLSQGLTPHRIALTLALGAVLGMMPLLGASTVLCAVVALALGLNLPLIQLVNYLVYPLQILLLIPFVQVGQWLFREPPLPFSLSQITGRVRADPWRAVISLWGYLLHGLVAWLAIALVSGALIYIGSRLVLNRLRPVLDIGRE